MQRKFLFVNFFVMTIFGLMLSSRALAADFNPNFIISDAEITDYNSMTLDEISDFLHRRNGTLDSYITVDKQGAPKTAVQTFYEVAQTWKINPKYLMLLTQKEQSLLEDPSPTQKQYDWATGYGICDNCSMDDANVQRFKGLYRQINSAAAQTRYYMDNIDEFTYQPGKTYSIDNTQVTIQNTATAGLYNYTPHLHGNLNMFNLWNKYFSSKWPDGTLLQSDLDNSLYYLENGARRLIASKAVFASRFNASRVVMASSTDINSYPVGPDIKYLNHSILKSQTSGKMYMIVNDVKRYLADDGALKALDLNSDDVTTVADSELATYKDGTDITQYTSYPTGIIIQDSKAKSTFDKLYYLISGELKPIANKEIFDANFPGMKVKKVAASELEKYLPGNNVTLPEGWLVSTKQKAPTYKTVKTIVKKKTVYTKVLVPAPTSTVYVVSNHRLLPFATEAAFARLGYNKKNIKIVSDATIALHEIGPALTGDGN